MGQKCRKYSKALKNRVIVRKTDEEGAGKMRGKCRVVKKGKGGK